MRQQGYCAQSKVGVHSACHVKNRRDGDWNPELRTAKAAFIRMSCGFFIFGRFYGSSDVGAQARRVSVRDRYSNHIPNCPLDWNLGGRLATSRTDPFMAPLPQRTPAQTVSDHSLNLTHSLYYCLAFTEAVDAQIERVLDRYGNFGSELHQSLANSSLVLMALKDKLNVVIENIDALPCGFKEGRH